MGLFDLAKALIDTTANVVKTPISVAQDVVNLDVETENTRESMQDIGDSIEDSIESAFDIFD